MSKEEDQGHSAPAGSLPALSSVVQPRSDPAAAGGPSAARIEQINIAAGYKARFIRTRARYQRACDEQLDFTQGVKKAMAKQVKLQDEIDFLLDAIATANANRIHKASGSGLSSADAKRRLSSEADNHSQVKRQRTE